MKIRKKPFSSLIAFCVALALMPFQSAFASVGMAAPAVKDFVQVSGIGTSTSQMTLQQLQAKFPQGRYWNGGDVNSTTNSPCPTHRTKAYCNCFNEDGGQAWQCYGFALKLGYDAYGTSPRNWQTTTEKSYVDSLKPGDIVDNSGNPYHTVFVIGVTDTAITVGECNWGGNCIIKWGRSIPKSEIRNYGSLKIYIAPSRLSTAETPTPTPSPNVNARLDTWVSEKGQGYQADQATKATQFQAGKTYYFWFKFYDSNSGKLMDQLYPSSNYKVNMTVTFPNGQQGKAEYSNSGYDWCRVANAGAGTYTCKVTISGDFTASGTVNFTVPANTPASGPRVNVETLSTLNKAGTASLYPTVFKGYLRGTAKYDAYSDRNGTNRIGRIYPTDELKVQSVYTYNGALWMSALCPWDGYSSDRLIYTKLDALVNTGFAPYKAIASSSATVYCRSDLTTRYGSLGAGDAVTVVGQSGAYSQVIYPLAVGGYKIGWCQTSALSRPNISNVAVKSSNSVTLSLSLPANASSSLVIMDMNMKICCRGNASKSSISVGNLKSGVSYYYYIESNLSNGTGTVTSEVKKITLE